MKKKIKKPKVTLINNIKKGFRRIYGNMERPFKPSKKTIKKSTSPTVDLLTTNNICKKFYKRPQLMIEDFENVKLIDFQSRDGLKLSGLLYTPNKDSNKWVIACHWFAGHKNWGLHHAKVFAKLGYNIMAFDFRGHGGSQEDSTTMGAKEHWDLMGAVDWLKANQKIDLLAFMGTSMGAFTVNYCSLKYADELKEVNFKFVVSDCTYGSIFRLLIHVRNIYLWIIPKRRIKNIVKKIIEKHNKKEIEVDFNQASIFELLRNGYKPQFPTLFLHSKDDKVTPPTDTYELMLERSKYIEDDHLVYSFSMHTQGIRYHFKTFNYKIAEFIKKNDDEVNFDQIVDEWELLEFNKLDRLSLKLK
ncbi:alpha/beta hydrolase [Spiroplasma culicicola]|uniref:Serine aminopeptidase S33 domain-containing protein n=1 Tax=Spiroplasma culicicola AES-1 TaxID=1276246 RepID=W6A5P0_9MOLU|nr:alpha/beta fold hydrolase [Spiroplasma culicicola]AHI52448.1 hypothetical protein SCULI_v1c01070 [Spiroplasma culicicola AES-1]